MSCCSTDFAPTNSICAIHSFTNSLRLVGVVLVGLYVRFHKLRCDGPNTMAVPAQDAHPVVRSAAGLQLHHTRSKLRKERRDLFSAQMLPHNNPPLGICTMNLENFFGDVQTNRCYLQGSPSQDCERAYLLVRNPSWVRSIGSRQQ